MAIQRFLFGLVLLLLNTADAKAQGFNVALAAKLQHTLDSMRLAYSLKGISACVYYTGVGTWKGVTGESHATVPITPDMEFGIASNTKLFTSVLLLKLAETQQLSLDDSLHKHLPPMPHVNPNITIRQLLNHTSGLYDVTDKAGYPDSILANPNRVYTAAELMTWLEPPVFAAGTSWAYCNTNYLLAGMIAESVTGRSYGALLRDSILSPLHLDSTFLDAYDTVRNTVAHPWQGGVDKFATPRIALNSAAGAAGAMYSTSGEMVQWYKALMNGQVLKPTSLAAMTTFVGSGNYGLGISRAKVMGRTVWQHGGNIWGGYNSFMLYDTASGIIIGVFINQLPAQANTLAVSLLSTLLNNPVGINFKANGDNQKAYLMPNPATHAATIVLPNKERLQRIIVYNEMGMEVSRFYDVHFTIDDLPAGYYHLKATTQESCYTIPFLKQ